LAEENWTDIRPEDLLETLRERLLPLPFALALYHQDETQRGIRPSAPPCGALGENSLCAADCPAARADVAESAIGSQQPVVFQCPAGLLNFAVPFSSPATGAGCLLGGGIRATLPEPASLENLANAASGDEQGLLERFEALPSAERGEVEAAADKAHRIIPALLSRNLYALGLEKATRQFDVLADISREIDRATGLEQLFSLVGETLVVLLDLDAVVLVLAEESGHGFLVRGAIGLELPAAAVAPSRARDLLRQNPGGRPVPLSAEIAALFPGIDRRQGLCAPLVAGGDGLGFLTLFGNDLSQRDLRLLELLAGRTAMKLAALRQQQASQREKALAGRLVAMVSALSLSESCDELFGKIIEMAAELLSASSGSLMLLSEDGEELQIKASKGMNPALARSMNLRPGAGIAGRVARSGFPLLVTDIEKDRRIATPNRPRFRTKSFLSVPLKLREQTIGVLNLADKEGEGIFSESDLACLTAFADHAALMTERVRAYERTSLLEEQAVTDPLTGLYNRRLLERRLEEELSRSRRQRLGFTILLIDLDNFKTYNDLCGHLAGDKALQKTAGLLQGSAREMDVVTRYGGEEFCVLLPGTGKKESLFVAERVRRGIESEPFPRENELPLGRLTTSVGVASFPEDGESAADLLKAADVALYQAKEEGRNRIVLFDPKLSKSSRQAG